MSHERLEKSRQYLRRNANTGIGNAKHNLILNEIGGDGENSAADHGFARVFNQAREHANETGAIDLEVPIVTDVFNKMNVFARKQTQRLLIKLVEHSPHGNELFV